MASICAAAGGDDPALHGHTTFIAQGLRGDIDIEEASCGQRGRNMVSTMAVAPAGTEIEAGAVERLDRKTEQATAAQRCECRCADPMQVAKVDQGIGGRHHVERRR